MKDPNNSNNTNDEASASDATYIEKNKIKPSSTNRTSDIYERFLNRVQSIDSESAESAEGIDDIDSVDNYKKSNRNNPDGLKSSLESLDKFKNSSTYEPLDEDELRSFSSHEETIDSEVSDSTGIDIDFDSDNQQDHKHSEKKERSAPVAAQVLDNKNKHKALSTDEDAEEIYSNHSNSNSNSNSNSADHANSYNDANTEPLVETITKAVSTQKTKSTSSSKLLVIGIISGLLLSAAIMLLLNKTGFLSTSADNANNKDISPAATADTEQPAVIVADEQNEHPALNTQTPSADAPQTQQQPATNNDEAIANPPEAPTEQQGAEDSANSLPTEPAITIEDFKEEAQSTLYRETTD